MSFRCHSDVILWPKTWRDFCDGMTPKWKYLSLQGRFILEREGMTHGPRLTERQERVWNDPHYLAKEGQTVSKEGQTTPHIRSFPFSFLSFRPRSWFRGSFGVIREGKKHLEWPPNEVGTREGEGQKWADFPHRKASFLHHSTVILRKASFLPHSTVILLQVPLADVKSGWVRPNDTNEWNKAEWRSEIFGHCVSKGSHPRLKW